MELTPLQEAVLNYAKQHEQDLREKAIDQCTLYLANVPFDDLIGKYLTGCAQHKELNTSHDYISELEDEFKDSFWYTAIHSYLQDAKD